MVGDHHTNAAVSLASTLLAHTHTHTAHARCVARCVLAASPPKLSYDTGSDRAAGDAGPLHPFRSTRCTPNFILSVTVRTVSSLHL